MKTSIASALLCAMLGLGALLAASATLFTARWSWLARLAAVLTAALLSARCILLALPGLLSVCT